MNQAMPPMNQAMPLGVSEWTRGLLDGVLKIGTSDLHLSAGCEPWYRYGVKLVPIADFPPLTDEVITRVVHDLTGLADLPPDYKGDWDVAGTYKERRLRLSVYLQGGRRAIAIRIIPDEIKTLAELKVPSVFEKIVDTEKMGLIVICGATGSGKSTTLSAAIDRINATRAQMILTIEDPIEYKHASKMSLVHQREVGRDTCSFDVGVYAAMRQDPDVIMVGEMRDIATMEAAIKAAETGHLVMTTVHAMDVVSAVNRIVGVFPANQQAQIRIQLAGTLKCVVVQKLLPKKGDPEGKTLIAEVMVVNPAVAGAIRENNLKDLRDMLETQRREYGSQSLRFALGEAVDHGDIEELEARRILPAAELELFERERSTGPLR